MATEVRSDFGGLFYTSVTHDPASLATLTAVDTAVTVAGLLTTDVVVAVIPPAALNAGLSIQSARVTAANTLTYRMYNSTAGALDAASGTWGFVIGRR